MDRREVYFIRPQGRFSLNLRELWQYRELFFFFTWRDVKVKYKQTVLGFLWAIVQPLAMMLVFTLFFSNTLDIPTDGLPAPVFYYSGLLIWNFFSSSLTSAGNSMVNNAHIIKKIYFPRLIIPISSVLVALFDLMVASIIYLLLVFYYDFTLSDFNPNYFKLLGFTFIAVLFAIGSTLGVGTLLAALNVQYRDFRYVIPFLVQFLFFVTPVIYSVNILGEANYLQYVLAINPLTGAIELTRSVFTNKFSVVTVMISLSSMTFFLVLGIYTFRKMEAYFADIA